LRRARRRRRDRLRHGLRQRRRGGEKRGGEREQNDAKGVDHARDIEPPLRRRKGGNFAPIQPKWLSQKAKTPALGRGFACKRSSDQYFA